MKTLIVCDVQPDVVQKLQQPRQFVDLVLMAVQAARQSTTSTIVYTMLKFDEQGYAQIPPSHPRLGILRRLYAKNPNLKWFTSSALSIPNNGLAQNEHEREMVVTRSTFLPQANDTKLIEVLRNCISQEEQQQEFTVVGYGPTVQAMCHLLGDVLAVPNVQILRECVRDEKEDRCQAFLEHGLLFQEEVMSLVDYLESMDLLHERIDIDISNDSSSLQPPSFKYVSDCGRGGHLSLFMPYLLRDYGYCLWPTQPWYKELASNKEYHCPLGKRVVDLCDEPQFGHGTRFFLAGRQHLDEKNLLHQLVPEMMPPTFESIEVARDYANNDKEETMIWFLKKVNQNGGRAVTVTNELPTEPLAEDEQLQVHVPRPLLFDKHPQQQLGNFKCHVKTYQYIACTTTETPNRNGKSSNDPPATITAWQLYMHDLFYLATANRPWSPDDLSDDVQITTMRTHRLYPDNPWRVQWNLTETCRANMQTVLQRAVEQGKLQPSHLSSSTTSKQSSSQQPQTKSNPAAALQFEVNSADWMLDEDGRMYLIECNGIPVLYDAGMPQDLVTKGLQLYDRLYKENPDTAVVNDHDLLQEAIGLALTGTLPKTSLWKHVATIATNGA